MKIVYICNWIASKSDSSGVTTRFPDKQTVRASAHAEPLVECMFHDKEGRVGQEADIMKAFTWRFVLD